MQKSSIEKELFRLAEKLTKSDRRIFTPTFRNILNFLSKSETRLLIKGKCNFKGCKTICGNRYFCSQKKHCLYAKIKGFPLIGQVSEESIKRIFDSKITFRQNILLKESFDAKIELLNLSDRMDPISRKNVFITKIVHSKNYNKTKFTKKICNFHVNVHRTCRMESGKDYYCFKHRTFAIEQKYPLSGGYQKTQPLDSESDSELDSETESENEQESGSDTSEGERGSPPVECIYNDCIQLGVNPDYNYPELKYCDYHTGLSRIEDYPENYRCTIDMMKKCENILELYTLASSIQFGCQLSRFSNQNSTVLDSGECFI